MERPAKQLLVFAALAAALAFPSAGAEVQLAPPDDVQKALDAAAPGDTIVLKDGVYYQRLTITRGGTAGKPVTLKAATGGGATISGAVPPDQAKLKFELAAGESDIYKAPVPQRVWWVMADGRNLVNYGFFSYLKKSQFPNQSSGALKRCTPEGFAWRNGYLYVRLPGGADPSTASIEISCPTGGRTSAEPELAKKIRWAPDSGFDVPGVGHLFSWSLANVTVKADHVVIEGLRLHMGVGAAVVVHGNEVTVRDCYITGTHMGICQPDEVKLTPRGSPRPITPANRTSRGLTVEYCEFSGAPGYESCRRGFWGGLCCEARYSRAHELRYVRSTLVPVPFPGIPPSCRTGMGTDFGECGGFAPTPPGFS